MEGIEWQEMLGGGMGDGFFDIQPTMDGNFIAVGGSGSWDLENVPVSNKNGQAWVVKLNQSTHSVLWQKLIGEEGYDQGMSIIQGKDHAYVVAGFSNSTQGDFAKKNHGKDDAWVVKLDNQSPQGNPEWQTLMGGNGNDHLQCIRPTADNGYIVAGYTESDNITNAGPYNGNTDIYVAKLDQKGKVIWEKVLGGTGFDTASSIFQTSDGDYILAGYSESPSIGNSNPNHGYMDIVLMRLDSYGNPLWTKLLGGRQGEATALGNAIQPTLDGGYIVVGQSLSSKNEDVTEATHGSSDVWTIKFNRNDAVDWQTLLGGTGYDDGTAIRQTSNGDYILAGRTTSDNSGDVGPNNGYWDIWVAKLSSEGKLIWQDVLGGNAYDQCTGIQPTSDEGFIFAGYIESSNSGNIGPNKGYQDGWIVNLKPRLVVDVIDSSTNSWVPNTTVVLTETGKAESQIVNAVINGRVVFNGSGSYGQNKFVKGKEYTISSTANYYYPSSSKSVKFEHDGQLETLLQQPTNTKTNKSFSITCIENYDHICGPDGICSLSGSFDECNNVASKMLSAGYKMNFYHKDGDVTEKDFATDPSYTGDKLTESVFHYHSGHGSTIPDDEGEFTSLIQFKGFSNADYLIGNNQIRSYNVEKKWGGNTKWVAIQSCKILQDESWWKAISTSHGILGYSTSTGVNSSFSTAFLNYALDKNKKMTIVSAYKQATRDTWHDDIVTAAVITKTHDQYEKDQFPGVGTMAQDGIPDSDIYYIKHWTCGSGMEW
jgi:hypothetical protein